MSNNTAAAKLEHFIKCLRANLDGKEVQYRGLADKWSNDVSSIFDECFADFNASNWRVKPDAPTVRPYSFETAPYGVKGRCKTTGKIGVLQAYPGGVIFFMGIASFTNSTYAEAAELFELLDGSPYGIQEQTESEWPKWAVSKGGVLWTQDEPSGWWTREEDDRLHPEAGGAAYIWDDLVRFFKGIRLISREEALAIIEGGTK